MRFLILAAMMLLSSGGMASARDITVATWNLGWHIDKATAHEWIAACDATYIKDSATGLWSPSTASGARQGWTINAFDIQGWDSTRLPVCNVFRAKSGATVPVTQDAYAKRSQQIAAFVQETVAADIIAFQEIGSLDAVREVLPNAGAGYEICTYAGFKVQRLAIAWRKALGQQIACKVHDALALVDPADQTPFEKQPRPGLQLELEIDGTRLQIMTVHLKSSCVSPFADQGLAGGGDHCPILQKQIPHLEAWVEQATSDQVKTILLGDFNRNFWHELADASAVRTDGTDPAGPLASGAKINSLFEEVFDRTPNSTYFVVLPEICAVNQVVREIADLICATSEARELLRSETDLLGNADYLGCRNPVGLDHILLGPGIAANSAARHLPLGPFGGTLPANGTHPDPLLAIADHCPLIATVAI